MRILYKNDFVNLRKLYFLQTGLKRFDFSGILVLTCILFSTISFAQVRVLDSSSHHLRISDQPEWEEFANSTPKKELVIRFDIKEKTQHTVSLVQYDVKQNWSVFLNDRKIGPLVMDGNKMRIYFELMPEVIRIGENKLTIKTETTIPDDIVISEITLDERPLEKLLTEARVDIDVIDRKTNNPIPSRITIVDKQRILQSTGTKAANHLAIRPGFVYTADGKVSLQVPSGEYIIYAGRGFEYGVDSVNVSIKAGQHFSKKLIIQREVQTDGWISSDTHIHTLTHSGHGDATDLERALTIAGEGVELPVITEHNMIPDFSTAAKKTGVDIWFTIATGDEVTTSVGHFNVFPLAIKGPVPDHRVKNWDELSQNLPAKDKTVVILNHGRDIHNGFSPFDPKRHISIAGYSLDNWKLPANAMEIVNSGALQDDPMKLVYDWFGLLNRGFALTPVGSSDSHDVSRYLVGQARTYVKTGDADPGRIDIEEAVTNLKQGRVMVSFGLLPKVIVNKKYGPGDQALFSKNTIVDVEVAGPGWVKAERVSLYANGIKIREEKVTTSNAAGIKWKGQWRLPHLKQDVFLVVIAEGSGDHLPFWPIVKPYQPVSTSWKPYTMGVSGAVWIDADQDGKISNAHDYAKKLVTRFGQNLTGLFKAMSTHDEAVAVQVAALLHESGMNLLEPVVATAVSKASNSIQEGFEKFIQALKQSQGE